tara:strand:- start:1701 stop:3695 length:1995 start_codon:yes stop_codon:yes gene_type:complete
MNLLINKDREFYSYKGINNIQENEIKVLNFLEKNLDLNWSFYLHPYLNGLKPDLILLNEFKEIVIIRFTNKQDYFYKEWDHLRLIKREIENVYCPSLWDENSIPLSHDPEEWNMYQSLFKPVIRLCIASPDQDTKSIEEEFFNKEEQYQKLSDQAKKYYVAISEDTIKNNSIEQVFPHTFSKSKYMNGEIAKELRYWLLPPKEIFKGTRKNDYALETLREEKLDKEQTVISTTKTESGYRKIIGPAGSGKTLCLASKSVNSIKKGKSVLFVTFNRSLVPYLMLNVFKFMKHDEEFLRHENPGNIFFDHFHNIRGKLKLLVGEDAFRKEEKSKIFSDEEEEIEDIKVLKIIEEIKLQKPERLSGYQFDVILLDEFQDWNLSKFNLVKSLLKKNGEIYIAGDPTQDVYAKGARNWFEKGLQGTGMVGRPRELKTSYRVPHEFLPLVTKFLSEFLVEQGNLIPEELQTDLLRECKYKWYQVSNEGASNAMVLKIIRFISKSNDKKLNINNLLFLSDTNISGAKILIELFKEKICEDIKHTYPWPLKAYAEKGYQKVKNWDENQWENKKEESLRKKYRSGFFINTNAMKASTIESFKGLESNLIILQIDGKRGKEPDSQYHSRVYTGLTRLKMGINGACHIFVVCSDSKFKNYGDQWSKPPEKPIMTY